MTRDDLEQLPARELDALVAEIVMGIEARGPKRCMHTGAIHHEDTVVRSDLPFYSTSWDGFGLVVERMRELSFASDIYPNLGFLPGKPWDVCFQKGHTPRYEAVNDSLPRAAAIAAVLAVQAIAPQSLPISKS